MSATEEAYGHARSPASTSSLSPMRARRPRPGRAGREAPRLGQRGPGLHATIRSVINGAPISSSRSSARAAGTPAPRSACGSLPGNITVEIEAVLEVAVMTVSRNAGGLPMSSRRTSRPAPASDIRRELGLRPIINVSGTMTALGASIMVPGSDRRDGGDRAGVRRDRRSAARREPRHRPPDRRRGRLRDASCASGIAVAVAGSMTGDRSPRHRAAAGHDRPAGRGSDPASATWSATAPPSTSRSGLRRQGRSGRDRQQRLRLSAREAITERTAAALYVVSHHTVSTG